MTSYSDEEVKEAIKGLGEFLDWAKAQHLVSENSAWKESAKLIWAAEQYLKLKRQQSQPDEPRDSGYYGDK